MTTASTAISSSAFETVIAAIQAQISVSTVVEILAYGAGLAIGLVFLWWGVRKSTRMLMAAFKKGKISV